MPEDKRRWTVLALMLAMFLTAVDVTIVDTAMPRIVGSLGGFSMLTWLVTAYMLTSTTTVPIYGKLADLFGRKRTFTAGAAIFVVGSLLCGRAQSMEQLILFRAVQGLGAGAIIPVVQTIIGDIFSPEERAKVQGWFSGVWGFSALIGPLVGGLITDFADWRWLFYINLPLGALAMIMVWRNLDEKVEKRKVQVDYLGSITLTVGISLLLLAMLTVGTEFAWNSPQILGMVAGGLLCLGAFVLAERRAADPMLPLGLFRRPEIGIPVVTSFLVGGLLYGFTVYLPLWAQGVQLYSATQSGASLLWLSIGWPISAVVAGRLVLKLGVRPVVLMGLGLQLLGGGLLVLFGRTLPELSPLLMAVLTFIAGWGMGSSTTGFILGVQGAVSYQQRGVATASLQFMRTLGGMVWVSLMGGVMNLGLLRNLQGSGQVSVTTMKEAGDIANELLEPATRVLLDPAQVELIRLALADALRDVHLVALVAAVLSLLCALRLPRMQLAKRVQPAEAPAKAAD